MEGLPVVPGMTKGLVSKCVILCTILQLVYGSICSQQVSRRWIACSSV